MKTKVMFYSFVVSLALMGILCRRHTSEPTPVSSSYYPLQVGNEWHYDKVEGAPFTISVTSKKMIDSKTYYIKSSSEFESNEILEREENGIVYRRIEENEYVYLDFNRAIGDTWQGPPPGKRELYIASRSETISTNLGVSHNCIKIVAEDELSKFEHIYAPGIGLVSLSMEAKNGYIVGGDSRLLWALIDGVVIRILN